MRIILGNKPFMSIKAEYKICVMCEDYPRELNIRWQLINWKVITAHGQQLDSMKVEESLHVYILGINSPVLTCLS